ncbi:hypothetical protein ACIP97_03125 [Peribacillus frigoritolerans]
MERKVRDSCGKSVSKETPQAKAEEAPETARGSEYLEWKSRSNCTNP